MGGAVWLGIEVDVLEGMLTAVLVEVGEKEGCDVGDGRGVLLGMGVGVGCGVLVAAAVCVEVGAWLQISSKAAAPGTAPAPQTQAFTSPSRTWLMLAPCVE